MYAAVGSELSTYSVALSDASLERTTSVTLPFAVQYAWPHPTKKFLYVAWSNGMQGDRHGISAYRVDPATGALALHGQPVEIRHRPVHLTLDADASHLLVAYNNPSSLSVHTLHADGTLGGEVTQPGPIDSGIYAHQIRVHPSNRMVVLVTRGNGPTATRGEDPGAVKIYRYRNGIVENHQSIAPNGGFGYQPRHIDFHPTQPFLFLNLERQNQLQSYRIAKGDSVEEPALFTKGTLDNPSASKPQQMTGAIHTHPNGRFVYISNRASGTTTVDGRPVWEGGENTIGVYAIDQKTGEPTRIQNIDSGGMHARTFALDEGARLLVAANQNAVTKREGTTETRVPASLAVFRIGADGKLAFVRKYDVETGQKRDSHVGGHAHSCGRWKMNLRRSVVTAGVLVAVTMPLMAQDRMPPIPPEKQTAEQRKAAEAFRANRKQDVFGPFVPLSRSPEVMLRAMAMGDYLRYKTVFPTRLNEFIILITSRHFTQQYEWYVHYPIAIKEGLSRDIADAIADGRRPTGMSADEELIHDFCTELLRNNSVSDPTYARAVARFGEQGTIEMVGVVAYYTFQSMVLNTARTPVPPGAPALKPFPQIASRSRPACRSSRCRRRSTRVRRCDRCRGRAEPALPC